jgi:hypothetical protein
VDHEEELAFGTFHLGLLGGVLPAKACRKPQASNSLPSNLNQPNNLNNNNPPSNPQESRNPPSNQSLRQSQPKLPQWQVQKI